MMQLLNLIEKLNTDKLCACDVTDSNTGKALYRNYTHAQITAKFGTAETFFESLKEHQNLTVREKRKTGNAFKFYGEPFNISSTSKTATETPQPNNEKTMTAEVPKKKKKKKKKNNNLLGLGMADVFDLKVQARERTEFERKNQELERENKELKTKNEELREEQLLRKYTVEKSDSFNNMLAGAIKQAPEIIRGFGFVPNAQNVAGLGSPETENLTETQQTIIESIKSTNSDTVNVLQVILNKMNTADETFGQDLFTLLQKHNMIE